MAQAGGTHLDPQRAILGPYSANHGELRGPTPRPFAPDRGVEGAAGGGIGLTRRGSLGVSQGSAVAAALVCSPAFPRQYLFAIGSSSAGNSVITRQPLSVTTTSSSM